MESVKKMLSESVLVEKIDGLKVSLKQAKTNLKKATKANRVTSVKKWEDKVQEIADKLELYQNQLNKGWSKEALKSLKNEAFDQHRGLFASFNTAKAVIKAQNYGGHARLTKSVQVADVLGGLTFAQALNLIVTGLNYGAKSNYFALVDTINGYLQTDDVTAYAVDGQKVNSLLVSGDIIGLVTLYGAKVNKSQAAKIYKFDAELFAKMGLNSLYNHAEELKIQAHKKYENSLKYIREFEAMKADIQADSKALNA
jgi:hypothetical protein